MTRLRHRQGFGLVRSDTVYLPAGGERRINLHLPPAPAPGEAILEGVVLDDRSRPVVDAHLALRVEPDRFLVATARSREKGRFRFPPLAPGQYSLQVCARGWQAQEIHLCLRRGIQRLTVRLTHAHLRGAVTGWVTGPGHVLLTVPVTVVLQTEAGKVLGRQRAAADGEFAFADLSPGSYRVGAMAQGYAPATTTLETIAGVVSTLSLRLTPSPPCTTDDP